MKIRSLFRQRNKEQRSLNKSDFFDTPSSTKVTEMKSIQLSAVFSSVKVLAESVASLPWFVFKRDGDAKVKYTENPLYKLLHDRPNEYMTSFTFRETIVSHLALWGNAYVEIQRDRSGLIRNLYPIPPDDMEVLVSTTGKKSFRHKTGKILGTDKIWHIPAIGFDGYKGMSPIQAMKNSIGLTLTMEDYGKNLWENDSRPRGVLSTESRLTDEAIERMRASWENIHRGSNNAGKVAILEQGLAFKPTAIPPGDAQFLETRKFQTAEIARIFRVPPHMIGDLEKATFSNIEQQSMEFVQNTLRPWLVRIEQSANATLFEEDNAFCEFSVDGLLRGDIKSRYEAYAIGRQWGFLSINDIRKKENENKLDEDVGDVYLTPLNMTDASKVNEPQEDERGLTNIRKIDSEERSLKEPSLAGVERRKAIEHDFDDLFSEAATKTVKRERADILNGIKKYGSTRDITTFRQFIQDYYANDSSEYIRNNFAPVFSALFSAVSRQAADEISTNVKTDRLEGWQEEYVETFLYRYRKRSRSQILKLLNEAEEDFQEAVEQRVDEWVEKRPDKIAREENVRAASAVAKFVWAGAGYASLRWVTFGDTCPHCRALSGKEVKMEGVFLREGEEMKNEGEIMTSSSNIGHPPLHPGCDCSVAPGSF